jgi:hypothetical protein
MSENYDNVLNTLTIDDAAMDEALALDAARPRPGRQPLPKGRYTCYLTDWTEEIATAGLLEGQTRYRATFETDVDGVGRKLFADFTVYPAKFEARDGKPASYVREFVLAAQITKALGLRGKPLPEVLDAARTAPVSLEVGIDRKNSARNVVYAVHSSLEG